MRRTLARSIRRVVLLALAPASVLACGDSTNASSLDASEDTAATGEGGASETDAAVDALDPLDASTADRVCSRCDPGPCIESCDPARYDDGDTGPCAPSWLYGDACVGGQVFFPCGLPAPSPGSANCPALCMGSDQFNGCRILSADGGIGPAFGGGGSGDASDGGDVPVVIDCYVDCTGRRPSNLLEETPRCARTIGEVLASAAYLEAASVVAFVDLAAQLEAYGAPATLVRALRRAARDEVRHARDITALARARGAEPDTVCLGTTGPRSLVAMAIENAREGCVRETWGAACAVAQSKRATDPEIRQAMRAIARDELAHASLSWEVADWLGSRLDDDERARVEEEKAVALAELKAELQAAPDERWRAKLGLPSRNETRRILDGMSAEVWVRAA